MKNIHQTHRLNSSKNEKKEKVYKSHLDLRKKEKLLSAGVYGLIIVITIALMLILFNLLI